METLISILTPHEALAVIMVTLAARVGVPVPAASLLVVAGGLASAQRVSLPLVFVVAIVANVLADGV
jgi:membrane protein DedA with SNARE-associated domain